MPDVHALDNLSTEPLFVGNVSELEGDKIICDPYEIKQWLPELLDYGIHHLLVEGGGRVLQSFIDTGVVDQWHRFSSTDSINDGIPAPKLHAPHTTHNLAADRYDRS